MGYTERYSLSHIEYFIDNLDNEEERNFYKPSIIEMLNNLEVYYNEKRMSDEKYGYLKRRLSELVK